MAATPAAQQELFERPVARVLSLGGGVDSFAMLVGMHAREERPDLILFADTGDEKPETYAYLPIIQAWLARVGFPPVIVVRRAPTTNERGTYATLSESCVVNHTLPSLAFGFKGCSAKWKIEPQNAYVRTWEPARVAWAAGAKVRKFIGYDAGPKDSKRCVDYTNDKLYTYHYPLREWGWDREECQRRILAAGLPLPCKSACFMCPATQPDELRALDRKHPHLGDRIVEIEAAAAPFNREIDGLWRKPVKGLRGATPRPGSMTEFIRAVRERGNWVSPDRLVRRSDVA